MRKVWMLGAVLLVATAGCAVTESGGSGGGEVRTVQVDGSPEEVKAFALAYFPSRVTVRPGDTVRFEQVWTGEPHSVTLGTLVDEAIPEARKLEPGAEPSAELATRLEALPVMLPEGPGDANQVAVNPCYVASGPVPTDAATPCPVTEQPAFDGTMSYYNSGFIAPGETVDVPLSDDIEPGTYSFYCNLHGAAMSGEIEVVAPGTQIPSQQEVDAARDAELEATFAPLLASYSEAKQTLPFGNLAGFGCQECGATGTMEFVPEPISVAAGEKVTWTVFGPHTITFKPPSGVGHPLVEAEDGTWHADGKALAPAGGPGMPPPAEAPAEAGPPVPQEIDGGSWDGRDFRSSGFIFSLPAPGHFFSYSLTFTEPGTYTYVCLIHPTMTGQVEVT